MTIRDGDIKINWCIYQIIHLINVGIFLRTHKSTIGTILKKYYGLKNKKWGNITWIIFKKTQK